MRHRGYVRRLLAFALVPALVMSACEGTTDEGDDDEEEIPPAISIALSNAALEVLQGGNASTNVTLTRTGSFTGPVTITAEGLPTGVTAAPVTIAAGQTQGSLSLSADAAAAPTTGTVTVRASGTGVSAVTALLSVNLQVRGSYAIAASPATVSAAPGGNVSTVISITRTGGFAGAVAFTATAPAGITASVAPTNVTGTSVATVALNLAIGASVTPGVHAITVRGTSPGLADQTTTVNVTVALPGSFTLALNPTSLTLQPGASGTANLAIQRLNNFTGTVALTATAPTGLNATLAPASTGGDASVLTVTADAGVAPGAYTVTVRGNATGITEQTVTLAVQVNAAPAFTMTVAPATVTVAQAGTGTAQVNLSRTGGFTGAVALTADAPAGITVTFAPQSATGDASVVTIAVGGGVAAGNHTVTVRANSAGQPERTAVITVQVTQQPAFSLTVSPATLSVQAGANGSSSVGITRSGGFAGAVALTADAPAGITATFNPTSVTGDASTLDLAVGSGMAAGSYTVTVRANATGLTERTATVALTVTAAPVNPGTGNVSFQFCGYSGFPTFVAYRDGTSGAWTAVGGASGLYRFQIDQGRGSVVYVLPGANNGFDMHLFSGSTAELQFRGGDVCVGTTGNGKSVTATLSGMGASDQGYVTLGRSQGTRTGPGDVTINNALEGSVDLVISKIATSFGGGGITFSPSRFLLQRGLNPANNANLGTFDMTTAGFAPATGQLTINNLNGWTAVVVNTLRTAGGSLAFLYTDGVPSSTTPRTWYGIPNSLVQLGDMHALNVAATPSLLDASQTRQSTLMTDATTNRSVTLGPVMTAPTVTTVATAPYARLSTQYTVQSEYNRQFVANYQQQGSAPRTFTAIVTNGFTSNAGSVTLEVPDLTAVSGWNNTWGLMSGVSTTWVLTATGWSGNELPGQFVDGAEYKSGTRLGTITP